MHCYSAIAPLSWIYLQLDVEPHIKQLNRYSLILLIIVFCACCHPFYSPYTKLYSTCHLVLLPEIDLQTSKSRLTLMPSDLLPIKIRHLHLMLERTPCVSVNFISQNPLYGVLLFFFHPSLALITLFEESTQHSTVLLKGHLACLWISYRPPLSADFTHYRPQPAYITG